MRWGADSRPSLHAGRSRREPSGIFSAAIWQSSCRPVAASGTSDAGSARRQTEIPAGRIIETLGALWQFTDTQDRAYAEVWGPSARTNHGLTTVVTSFALAIPESGYDD
jgi:hypothetical protein